MSNISRITDFISEHSGKCRIVGRGRGKINIPEYDPAPLDYLDLAQMAFDKNTPESLIKCVDLINRALDCQMDILLQAINFYDVSYLQKEPFLSKVKVAELMGMIHPDNTLLINALRKKLDHEGSHKTEDVKTYYLLSRAFIHIVDMRLIILSFYASPLEWYEKNEAKKIEDMINITGMSIHFKQEIPSLTFVLHEKNTIEKLTFEPKDKKSADEYLKAMHIYFGLYHDHITSQLNNLK